MKNEEILLSKQKKRSKLNQKLIVVKRVDTNTLIMLNPAIIMYVKKHSHYNLDKHFPQYMHINYYNYDN